MLTKAYVGLCYVSTRTYLKKRLEGEKGSGLKKAANSYDYWAKGFMQKLYVFLDLSLDGIILNAINSFIEQLMISQLAEHGLEPTDLSRQLIIDAKAAV
jgi:hypothetical protein